MNWPTICMDELSCKVQDYFSKCFISSGANEIVCPLGALPYVPLLKILRFLDEKSLLNLSLTDRRFYTHISQNKKRLVERKVYTFWITNSPPSAMRELTGNEPHVCYPEHHAFVRKRRTFLEENELFFQDKDRLGFSIGSLNLSECWEYILGKTQQCQRKIRVPLTASKDFWDWFAEHFETTTIKCLEFDSYAFVDSDVEYAEKLLRRNGTRVNQLVFYESIGPNDIKSIVRFLKIFKPNCLNIQDTRVEIDRLLNEETFREYMQTLECLYIDPICDTGTVNLPNFIRYPPVLEMYDGYHFPLDELRNAIETWRQGDLQIAYWGLLLTPFLDCYAEMVVALRLTHKFADNGQIVFTNVRKEKCYLRFQSGDETDSVWYLYVPQKDRREWIV